MHETEHVTFMTLPCRLTDEELDERRDLLARNTNEIGRIEEEKANVSKHYGEQIKSLSGEAKAAAKDIAERQTMRTVRCKKFYDMDHGEMQTIVVREDTGEVVRLRPMTAEEQQILLGEPSEGLSKAIRKAVAEYKERRAKLKLLDELNPAEVPEPPDGEDGGPPPAPPETKGKK